MFTDPTHIPKSDNGAELYLIRTRFSLDLALDVVVYSSATSDVQIAIHICSAKPSLNILFISLDVPFKLPAAGYHSIDEGSRMESCDNSLPRMSSLEDEPSGSL